MNYLLTKKNQQRPTLQYIMQSNNIIYIIYSCKKKFKKKLIFRRKECFKMIDGKTELIKYELIKFCYQMLYQCYFI